MVRCEVVRNTTDRPHKHTLNTQYAQVARTCSSTQHKLSMKPLEAPDSGDGWSFSHSALSATASISHLIASSLAGEPPTSMFFTISCAPLTSELSLPRIILMLDSTTARDMRFTLANSCWNCGSCGLTTLRNKRPSRVLSDTAAPCTTPKSYDA